MDLNIAGKWCFGLSAIVKPKMPCLPVKDKFIYIDEIFWCGWKSYAARQLNKTRFRLGWIYIFFNFPRRILNCQKTAQDLLLFLSSKQEGPWSTSSDPRNCRKPRERSVIVIVNLLSVKIRYEAHMESAFFTAPLSIGSQGNRICLEKHNRNWVLWII
jgi:hypothetical protein